MEGMCLVVIGLLATMIIILSCILAGEYFTVTIGIG